MKPETRLQTAIMRAVSPLTRIFRNNVGYDRYRRVKYGLCNGSADLIGWTPVTITPAHVGKTLAVFTAIEVKAPTGRVDQRQQVFLEAVREDGGIAVVGRDPESTAEEIRGYKKP